MYINQSYLDIITSEEKAKKMVSEILEKGYVLLPNFLEPSVWQDLKTLADTRSIVNKKNEDLEGTIAHAVSNSDEIFAMSEAIHKTRCQIEGKKYEPLKREKQWVGFPYKDARGGAKTVETDYHFDGAYVNFVLPIMLPPRVDAKRPDIELFVNLRKKYPYYVAAVFARLIRHIPFFRNYFGVNKLQYEVGTMIVFFGDLTFHGVPSILAGERLVMTINSHW